MRNPTSLKDGGRIKRGFKVYCFLRPLDRWPISPTVKLCLRIGMESPRVTNPCSPTPVPISTSTSPNYFVGNGQFLTLSSTTIPSTTSSLSPISGVSRVWGCTNRESWCNSLDDILSIDQTIFGLPETCCSLLSSSLPHVGVIPSSLKNWPFSPLKRDVLSPRKRFQSCKIQFWLGRGSWPPFHLSRR